MTSPAPGPLRRLAQLAAAPIQLFFRLEAASSWLLLGGAVLALAWANSPLGPWHAALFERPFALGPFRPTPLEVLDEGLMALFFLLVGLEIKRELVIGELSSFGRAVLPALAAVGGMLAPALIFAAFNHRGPGARGWGVPMATDIAFSIGLLVAFRDRVPQALIAFLTALAIFDDLGGILVIAIFYGHSFEWLSLGAALALAVALFLAGRARRPSPWLFAVLGAALWAAFWRAGVHATLAGVVVGMMVPVKSRAGDAVLERWEHALHPWVAFLIVPLFALGNAGLSLGGLTRADFLSPVAVGVTIALLVGKPVGILVFTWLGVATGISPIPGGPEHRRALLGTAASGGIGFTVALFIAQLAFSNEPGLLAQAKLGILAGSLLSAAAAVLVLRGVPSRPTA